MRREAPKFETGQDKTEREAGKIREREERREQKMRPLSLTAGREKKKPITSN